MLTFSATSNKIVKFALETPKSLQKPQLRQLRLPTLI